ncbi:BrnA antitoxin family protein [Rhizobium azibense]|uniref:Uncharacterized protein (DUF4415 family) n=1 Tax=Rhizobium azibense TaxID=1136135 RepID=A0A4R3RKF7_9HYPH|nr:BrnA antitoxin family protein [Rhizobium azibense]TCU34112.1 uncharacterized protein (DUF4415 family) [Rhizobium azibense]
MGIAQQLGRSGGLKSAHEIAEELKSARSTRAVETKLEKPKRAGKRLIDPAKGSRQKVQEAAQAPKQRPKRAISIRLDQEVIDHFKSGGEGWQSRINAALRKSASLSD